MPQGCANRTRSGKGRYRNHALRLRSICASTRRTTDSLPIGLHCAPFPLRWLRLYRPKPPSYSGSHSEDDWSVEGLRYTAILKRPNQPEDHPETRLYLCRTQFLKRCNGIYTIDVDTYERVPDVLKAIANRISMDRITVSGSFTVARGLAPNLEANGDRIQLVSILIGRWVGDTRSGHELQSVLSLRKASRA
jgi:hypothetical protein